MFSLTACAMFLKSMGFKQGGTKRYSAVATQKRARSGVLKGTKNWLPRSNQSVFGVSRIQLARISWKIEAKLTGLVTQRLSLKKNDAKQPKFPPCRN